MLFINETTGDEVTVIKWSWFVLEYWFAAFVMDTDRPPTAPNRL